MNSSLYSELGWLVECKDFRERYQAIAADTGATGPELRRLAGDRLTTSQLQRLASLLDEVEANGRSTASLVPLKVGLIGVGTLALVASLLRGTGLRYGLVVDCVTAEYGQLEQEAIDPHSTINRASCDVVLIALDYRGLPLSQPAMDKEDAAARLASSVAVLHTICRGIRANGAARIVLQTLAPPPETLFGSFDSQWVGSVQTMVAAFNDAIRTECDSPSTFLLDTAQLASTVGLANWHEPAQWNMAKFPFAAELLPLYADHVCRLLGALHGKARRALILDLDNTVWGGIVGDDGPQHILLGEGDATGEAFLHVQRLALTLRDRGVVLAICSKNTDEIARAPFREHPDMLLREEHIAAFKANWEDKASNIRAIAEELALGLDAFVFLDDNPAERALVRHYLPEVAVPELPEDPAYYARTLSAAGYFEAVSFSREDRDRADDYQANAARTAIREAAGNIDDFLASLEMRATLQPFDAMGRSRIQQLMAKSNQFNLTSRRYTESEIAELESDPLAFTLQVRLSDRLGDNGMISIVICRRTAPDVWSVDSWLMSCRVLRRGVEKLVLKEIAQQARDRGIRTLAGTYRPTARNALVKDHYANLGFVRQGETETGETRWLLPTDAVIEAPWFEVVRLRPLSAMAA